MSNLIQFIDSLYNLVRAARYELSWQYREYLKRISPFIGVPIARLHDVVQRHTSGAFNQEPSILDSLVCSWITRHDDDFIVCSNIFKFVRFQPLRSSMIEALRHERLTVVQTIWNQTPCMYPICPTLLNRNKCGRWLQVRRVVSSLTVILDLPDTLISIIGDYCPDFLF